MSRETEAGRRLLDRVLASAAIVPGERGLVAAKDILAIEAEAVALYRKDLAEKVRALPWEVHDDDEQEVLLASVLALIEGSDPASPEPCSAPGTDGNGFARTCILPRGHRGPHAARDSATEPRSLSEPLDELQALSDAATPGPWFAQGALVHGPDQGGWDIGPVRGWHDWLADDARYIVALVNWHRVRLATDPSAPEQEGTDANSD